MLNEKNDILAGNVAIVQSQDCNSLVPTSIVVQDLINITGDLNQTVQLKVFPTEAIQETPWLYVRSLFGVWIEGGDEDKQLEELYKSRLVPSSIPDEEE